MILLYKAVDTAYNDICNILGNDLSRINKERLEALINMRYNLGATGFRKFKRMIQALGQRDWDKVAIEAEDSLWYQQVGERAKRIVFTLRYGYRPPSIPFKERSK